MFYPCTEPAKKLLLYFHANAEDAGLVEELVRPIKESLFMHAVIIEYPKYGVYQSNQLSE
jgi:hypothetical protein